MMTLRIGVLRDGGEDREIHGHHRVAHSAVTRCKVTGLPCEIGWWSVCWNTLASVGVVLLLSTASPSLLASQDVWLDARNNNQTWFTGSYLPRYLRVRLAGLTPAECEERTVVFEAYSEGTVSPDSAKARWVVGEGAGWSGGEWCEAEARWQLSSATGLQKLRASIVGLSVPATGDTLHRPYRVFEAVARKPPRVMLGLAGILIGHSYDTLAIADGDTTVVPVREQTTVVPMFGVETPLLMEYLSGNTFLRGLFRRVRVFVGASIADPSRDFFFGIAPNPLIFGQQWEDISFQLAYGIHVGRRTVLGSVAECSERPNPVPTCQADRFYWDHPFIAVSMDASQLLGAVLRAIGIP